MKNLFVVLSACLWVSACGGGGGGDGGGDGESAPGSVVGNTKTNEGNVVRLDASAAASGRTATSYIWRQTGGTTVRLSNTRAAAPTFTAPEINGRESEVISFDLTITYSDGRETVEVEKTVLNSHVTITGSARFESVPFTVGGAGLDYASRSYVAARGVTVTAGANCGAAIRTSTDQSGTFTLRVPTGQNIQNVNICAEMVSAVGAKWDVTVVDNTNEKSIYGARASAAVNFSDLSLGTLSLPSGWSDSRNSYSSARVAGPFAALDAIYDAIQKTVAADANVDIPDLVVNWSPSNGTCRGSLTDGCIGTSFYSNSEMYLLGQANQDTDEYDRHVVIHEWGHFFEDNLSRSDSIGGSHTGTDKLDMRVAFSEGFGNAFSGIVTDNPAYRDSLGESQSSSFTNNVENNSSVGWHEEFTIQSLIYDLYDDNADDSDNLSLGWQALYEAFSDQQYIDQLGFTSIFSFIDRLEINNGSFASSIRNFATSRGINGTGPYAVGETNNAGLSNNTVLPVYTLISSGNPLTLCSSDTPGKPNKLANRRFAFFTTASGANSHRVTTSTSRTGGDTDLSFYLNGSRTHLLDTVGEESHGNVQLLPRRTYAVQLLDYGLLFNGTLSGEVCSTITITDNN